MSSELPRYLELELAPAAPVSDENDPATASADARSAAPPLPDEGVACARKWVALLASGRLVVYAKDSDRKLGKVGTRTGRRQKREQKERTKKESKRGRKKAQNEEEMSRRLRTASARNGAPTHRGGANNAHAAARSCLPRVSRRRIRSRLIPRDNGSR